MIRTTYMGHLTSLALSARLRCGLGVGQDRLRPWCCPTHAQTLDQGKLPHGTSSRSFRRTGKVSIRWGQETNSALAYNPQLSQQHNLTMTYMAYDCSVAGISGEQDGWYIVALMATADFSQLWLSNRIYELRYAQLQWESPLTVAPRCSALNMLAL
jgi:hypothetical protein